MTMQPESRMSGLLLESVGMHSDLPKRFLYLIPQLQYVEFGRKEDFRQVLLGYGASAGAWKARSAYPSRRARHGAAVTCVGIKCSVASTLSLVANRPLFAEIRSGISRIGLGPRSELPIHGMMFRSSISLIGQSEGIDGVRFVFIQLIRFHTLASPSFVFRGFL